MEESASKIYYSIREVAELLDEPESTLRFWESEFQDVIIPRRNERKIRSYTEKDIEDVQLVKHLIRDNGLTLDGVRQKLKNANRDEMTRKAKAIQRLRKVKAELEAFGKTIDKVFEQNKKNY